jgi:peptidoglycan hydrolase-like protein with peptidoglycan-binding domain
MVDMHLERLEKLQTRVREAALPAFQEAERKGLGVMIASGLRTYAEQTALYALGRTKPGKIVTNAEAGESYHNFGLAFDFCVIERDQAVWNQNHPHWKRFVRIVKSQGFDWGGDWSNPDYPHFQIKSPPSLSSLRAKYPNGFTPGQAETHWIARDELPLQIGYRDGRKRLVSKLQRRLGVEIDGRFGTDTEEAVRAWQAVHNEKGEVVRKGTGLPIDGVVHPNTWKALFFGT